MIQETGLLPVSGAHVTDEAKLIRGPLQEGPLRNVVDPVARAGAGELRAAPGIIERSPDGVVQLGHLTNVAAPTERNGFIHEERRVRGSMVEVASEAGSKPSRKIDLRVAGCLERGHYISVTAVANPIPACGKQNWVSLGVRIVTPDARKRGAYRMLRGELELAFYITVTPITLARHILGKEEFCLGGVGLVTVGAPAAFERAVSHWEIELLGDRAVAGEADILLPSFKKPGDIRSVPGVAAGAGPDLERSVDHRTDGIFCHPVTN